MERTRTLKNKALTIALAVVMACGVFGMTPISSHAADGYTETITVPRGTADGTYYGICEAANTMPDVADDHHPFSYMIEVAVTVENEKTTDVRVSHVDQSTARALDVDYMTWAVNDMESLKGIDTNGKTVETGVDSVSGATKSNLAIFRAIKDALTSKNTTPTYGYTEVADNAITAEDADYPESGKSVEVKLNIDEALSGAEYTIYNLGIAGSQYGGIRYNQGPMNGQNASTETLADADYDYNAQTQTVKIYNTENTGVGSYTINMYDASGKYEDVDVAFDLNDANVSSKDITLDANNTIQINDDKVSMKDLIARVESIEIGGVEYVTYTSNHGIYQRRSPGTALIGEDGIINLSAKINPVVAISENDYNITRGTNGATPIKGKNTYDVKLNFAGYPSATLSVVNNGEAAISINADQDDLNQTYGDHNSGSFIPVVKATNDKYVLTSSNTSVAAIRAKNKSVNIKGAGTTTLTATSADPTYVTKTATAVLTVVAADDAVSYVDGAVVIDRDKSGIKLSEYLEHAKIEITPAGGTAASYTAADVIDSTTGKINLDATVRSGKTTVTVFPSYNAYSFKISYDGFKDITGSITKAKETQAITTDKASYSKTYGNTAFSINAKAKGDTVITYKTSNAKVATVDPKGTVTIKGAGTSTITINAAESDSYKAATKTVKVTVVKAKQAISIKSNSKTVKASAVKKKAKTYSFTVAGSKSSLTTDKLTATHKKAISKVAVTGSKVKVTVKKGAKKGTYKVNVYAKSSTNYNASAKKTITIKVK